MAGTLTFPNPLLSRVPNLKSLSINVPPGRIINNSQMMKFKRQFMNMNKQLSSEMNEERLIKLFMDFLEESFNR